MRHAACSPTKHNSRVHARTGPRCGNSWAVKSANTQTSPGMVGATMVIAAHDHLDHLVGRGNLIN
jgi:hypothetical protein